MDGASSHPCLHRLEVVGNTVGPRAKGPWIVGGTGEVIEGHRGATRGNPNLEVGSRAPQSPRRGRDRASASRRFHGGGKCRHAFHSRARAPDRPPRSSAVAGTEAASAGSLTRTSTRTAWHDGVGWFRRIGQPSEAPAASIHIPPSSVTTHCGSPLRDAPPWPDLPGPRRTARRGASCDRAPFANLTARIVGGVHMCRSFALRPRLAS